MYFMHAWISDVSGYAACIYHTSCERFDPARRIFIKSFALVKFYQPTGNFLFFPLVNELMNNKYNISGN